MPGFGAVNEFAVNELEAEAAATGFQAAWVTNSNRGIETMKKNVDSQIIGVQMLNIADGTDFTGNASVFVTLDGGTQTAGLGTVPAHEGKGYHTYTPADFATTTPANAESDGDHIVFTFTGTGAITASVQVYTTFPQTVDNDVLLQTAQADLDIITGTGGANLSTATQASIDAIETDTTTDIPALIATAQADLDTITGADGVNLLSATQAQIDTIATDTTTDIPALIATAQADLDIITGVSGVNLLTATQASIDAIETDTTTDIPALIATAQSDLDIITGVSGVNLLTATQASIDAIETDTTTDIPALIATAQADLDIITGVSGVNLLTATQASIDAIETDTTTDIPALIATAQADLDIITGTTGVLLDPTATSAQLVDDTWDETRIGQHTEADSFGLFLDSKVSDAATAGISVSDIVNGVHNAPTSSHTAVGSMGAAHGDTRTATVTDIPATLTDMEGAGFATGTHSLAAIRARGDAEWTTGAGGSDRLLMVDTTIATLATQVSFTLTSGSTDDDAYNNLSIVIEDVSTATQKSVGMVLDYVGSTKTVTLKEALSFTIATTDKVYILAENSLKSTVANRQLDVTATGAAGIDWGNVENPTTANDLSGTDIQLVDTATTVTDGATSAAQTTAQNDLDIITGADGVNLLTATQASIDAIELDTSVTINDKIDDIQGAGFATGTDSLEAIRDRGDSAWITGAGGSDRLLMVDTTIATLATQVSFTLTAGSTDDDAYNNLSIVVEDVATSTQKAVGMVLDYTGSTKTVTLKEALAYTIAATDKVYILAENSLKSTVANRQIDVDANGEVIAAGMYDPAVDEMESGVTYQEGQRLMLAESAGKVSVSGTTVVFRDVNDSKARITATVDANGQRTAVTVDGA